MKLKGKAKAAFLARMARGRNKTKRTKHKRKHSKHTHSEGHVKKKRRHHTKHRKSGARRRHLGGPLGRWLPAPPDLISIGTGFAYGKVEGAASKDQAHFLNKVPAVVPQIGRAGNLGAIAWVGGVVTRHPVVKAIAKGLLTVAAYQNGRGSGFSKESPDFKMSGHGHRMSGPGHSRDELLIERYLQNARGNGNR